MRSKMVKVENSAGLDTKGMTNVGLDVKKQSLDWSDQSTESWVIGRTSESMVGSVCQCLKIIYVF